MANKYQEPKYDMCGDNRFEIIENAKQHILDATNIASDEDEMKALDSFLFRCWQMNWLGKYEYNDAVRKQTYKPAVQVKKAYGTIVDCPTCHSPVASLGKCCCECGQRIKPYEDN